MVNKKIVIIVTIIAIIVVTGLVYISLNREFQEQYTFSEENVENKVQDEVENNAENDTFVEENTTEENEYNEIEENSIENETSNELEDNEVSNNTSDNKENKAEKLTGKDKAIELVKKEWGENDNTVYYYLEEQVSDNVYIISVRDQATTQDLSIYKVDISSNSVEKD